MAFPKRFSLNAKSMPFAPLYSISMQYFYPNAISFRLFYRIKCKFKTCFFTGTRYCGNTPGPQVAVPTPACSASRCIVIIPSRPVH